MKLTTGQLVNGSSCDGIDMVIKDLDLEPKDDVGSKRYYVVPYGELDGIPIAFVARFGVIYKDHNGSFDVGIKKLHDDLEVTAAKEVIENGNAPPITKVVEGVETTIAPTTAKKKAQRRLELMQEALY
ncbi:hypothetical protein Tco_1576254 [Tanacetum coccineum]